MNVGVFQGVQSFDISGNSGVIQNKLTSAKASRQIETGSVQFAFDLFRLEDCDDVVGTKILSRGAQGGILSERLTDRSIVA